MKKTKKINKCRLCESRELSKILDFGSLPLGNDLALNARQSKSKISYRLDLNNCNSCNHFQLGYEVHSKKLFATNYTYLTGVAPSFINHFKNYADWIVNRCNLKKNDIVLDIGSNDGTCLKAFKKKKLKVIGIDPAILPSKIANSNRIFTYNKFFNKGSAEKIRNDFGEIDFITSHNVLAHVNEIKNVFSNILYLLKNNGYFCFEVGYFVNVVEKNLFDTIYHEHLDYHHANPIVLFLNKIGFQVINLSTNSVQGGTLRVLCKKSTEKNSQQVSKFLSNERKKSIYNKKYMSQWQKKIQQKMLRLNKFVTSKINENFTVYGYGAPTKAVLLLKLSKLSKSGIQYTIEDNKLKINKFIPQSSIEIVNFKKIITNKPNYLIIFAWNFVDDIVNKLKSKKIKNIKIIVPLPNLRTITL